MAFTSADSALRAVSDAYEKMLNLVQRNFVFKIVADAHRCSAICYDKDDDVRDIEACAQSCNQNVMAAQEYLQKEIHDYQSRLQRCVQGCEDVIKDKMTADSTKAGNLGTSDSLNRKVYEKTFETCIIKCAEDLIKLVPDFEKRIISAMKRSYY